MSLQTLSKQNNIRTPPEHSNIMSIDRRRFPHSISVDGEPVVSSLSMTHTLHLEDQKPIDEVLNEISEIQGYEFSRGLRKLETEISIDTIDFDIRVGVKLIQNSLGSVEAPATDRIRIKISTDNVSSTEIKETFFSGLEICSSLVSRTSMIWDKRETFSLTVKLSDQMVGGRETSRTSEGHAVEVFGPNVRVRDVEKEDLQSAVEKLAEI